MFAIRGRRRIVLLMLALLPGLAFAGWIVFNSSGSARAAFDNLREGMTVSEASAILGRDLRNDLDESEFFGASIDTYIYDIGNSVIPSESVQLIFFAEKLSSKEYIRLTREEIWSAMLYHAKKALNIGQPSARRYTLHPR